MLIVVDASPLIVLAKLNRLGLLHAEFQQVVIPPAVYREAVLAGQRLRADDATVIQRAIADGLIEVRVSSSAGDGASIFLGQGEFECIHLAIELDADTILLDDDKARRTAHNIFQQHNKHIAVRGTLGIIAGAVKSGHLDAQVAIALVAAIRDRDDVWINPTLCDQVIAVLREST